LSYAIGVAKPVSISVQTFGTNTVAEEVIVKAIERTFDLRPAAIIRQLELTKPCFLATAAYGHFGREAFRWEQLDLLEPFKQQLN
jgi:S-adenosylmethionine synthetase